MDFVLFPVVSLIPAGLRGAPPASVRWPTFQLKIAHQIEHLRVDAVLDIETRFDALARQLPLRALCVYDARQVSSGDFLRALKCHRDHSRHPLILG